MVMPIPPPVKPGPSQPSRKARGTVGTGGLAATAPLAENVVRVFASVKVDERNSERLLDPLLARRYKAWVSRRPPWHYPLPGAFWRAGFLSRRGDGRFFVVAANDVGVPDVRRHDL